MRAAVLSVHALTSADHARWDAFVHACPQATFFHLSAWQGLIEEVFRHRTHYLYAERAGAIAAVLPLAEVNSRLFGHALVSLPFCVYAGIAGEDDEAVALLEAEAEALALRLGVQHLEYRNLQARHADWPCQPLYATFRKAILPEVEANLLAIPRKQRAMVRKGIANGLRAQFDDDVARFFPLYAGNVLRHGTPALPRRYFARLRETFGPACEVLTVSDPAGRALSSVLGFRFRGEVLPYYAGDHVAARELAANDFKYWELMRHACERGDRLFDYGRSKLGTGPYAFKKNWGFEPRPLAYEYRLYKRAEVPQNNPANPRYRAFIALWRRLPLPVANALGPHIVRNLG
ncbi:FemAB family PEP-CTERM system-associated protein [Pseudothauera nasutitermitis]|uniref:FemAB family PEP-CTERM system-associated protein n=1 Tax=Pseudothauera nasutitermitis TaxID=2565930 RepID=A0A4S4AUL9_9RHOO|nr:FemAB family XrtA/PEP-CTERM system-associated protein [Pseudothauera nasutitermitis]THF63661.1 FemAB family PEP-CTERM system-associated protein [Pseudothauera nasutitermitis]